MKSLNGARVVVCPVPIVSTAAQGRASNRWPLPTLDANRHVF
jgi:hypothetical protein